MSFYIRCEEEIDFVSCKDIIIIYILVDLDRFCFIHIRTIPVGITFNYFSPILSPPVYMGEEGLGNYN